MVVALVATVQIEHFVGFAVVIGVKGAISQRSVARLTYQIVHGKEAGVYCFTRIIEIAMVVSIAADVVVIVVAIVPKIGA